MIKILLSIFPYISFVYMSSLVITEPYKLILFIALIFALLYLVKHSSDNKSANAILKLALILSLLLLGLHIIIYRLEVIRNSVYVKFIDSFNPPTYIVYILAAIIVILTIIKTYKKIRNVFLG